MLPRMGPLTKVALIGFMASGKSAIASLLAPRLGWRVCQLDDEIVLRSGLPSVAAIFKEHGEPYFRELEAKQALSHRDSQHVVIATGGGIINRASNIEHLKHGGGVIIYLRTSFEAIAERVGDVSHRPLFADQASALELYTKRLPVYESFADMVVDTDERSEEEVCAEVFTQLKSRICSRE